MPNMQLENELLKKYESRTNILKAIAHPTRLFILDILKEQTMCVCEINAMINADVSTVSKHLSVLRNAGLVSKRKEGLQVYYTLETPCLLDSLQCIEKLIATK